jgi:predicted ATPase
VALGYWRLGFISFGLGEYTTAQAHIEQVTTLYEPQYHRSLVFLGGANAGLSAVAYDACCLWCLGYPEQAQKRSQEALALTRELDHPFSLADVLCFAGCMLHAMRRDAQALKGYSEELMRLAHEKDMPSWLGMGNWQWGTALAMLGQVQEGMAQMRAGIAFCRSTDVWIYLPAALGALAEAQAKTGRPGEGLTTLDEALALVEETDERHWEAELYRLKGELLSTQSMQGDEVEAEASLHEAESCFKHAIAVARRQQAKSWELRATTSLARLWQKHGKVDEARQMLADVYGWFTEGFDTPDLQHARALLEELSRS